MNNGRPMPQARNLKATFLQLESQIRGMEVSEAKRLKTLKEENANLKKLLAEQMLDVFAHRDLRAKMAGPAAKRDVAAHLKAELGLSERRACQAI